MLYNVGVKFIRIKYAQMAWNIYKIQKNLFKSNYFANSVNRIKMQHILFYLLQLF